MDKSNTFIAAAIGIAILGGGSYYYIKKRGRNNDGTKPNASPSIASMTIASKNLTITALDASLMAQTLYNAMQGFGSDEKAIYGVFDKINSKDDLLLVIKQFGLRKNLWGTRSGFIGKDVNLIAWLNIDLSKSELNKIRPVFDRFNVAL